MTYPERYIDQTETNDAPKEADQLMPPLVSLAASLHELESELAHLTAQLRGLEDKRATLSEHRRSIRAELANLLDMAEHTEAKPARPTF